MTTGVVETGKNRFFRRSAGNLCGPWRGISFWSACCLSLNVFGSGRADALPAQAGLELRFEAAETAVINATRWDETQPQWAGGRDVEASFFDAVFRFLLVRFPGSAEAFHAKLSEGYELESVHLELRRADCPWPRAPGFGMRIWAMPERENTPEPPWRVGAWALNRPWTADREIGPTWNAYVQGSGWWRLGGARCPSDRQPAMLDEIEVSAADPAGRLDVTSVFAARSAKAAAKRLRAVCDHGFLVRRTEVSHYPFSDQGMSTGVVPLYVNGLALVARLRKAEGPVAIDPLPAPIDVAALARELAAAGGDGYPTTRMPENLKELVERWRARRRGEMPDWMWERVQEVWNLPFFHFGDPERLDADPLTALLKALDSADTERYAGTVMPWELDKPPGWFRGHSHLHDLLPLLSFPELLTDTLRYSRALAFRSRWPRGLQRDQMHHHYRVVTHTGTFNHMAQARPKAMLGAEVTGLSWLQEEARFGLFALNRKLAYTCGYSQEMGDSYYRGIALAPLQAASRFSRDPVMRLKAGLMMEKLLFTDICTYHPGLRHRVSRVSRRMGGLHQFVLHQDVPEAALHMLSQEGVLIETDRLADGPQAYGLPILDMHATPPVQVALVAPWGEEWERHSVDDKPLPFRSMFKTFSLGSLDDPLHAVTYMGRHYALGSEQVANGSVPVFAAWRVHDRRVERVPEMGILMLQGRVNNMAPDVLDKTPMGALQHDNKLIWAVKPPERHFLEQGVNNIPSVEKEGLLNFRAQAAIHAWGRDGEVPEVWVGDRRIETLPAAVSLDERIAVRDGVSYIGLRALPTTDLGRDREVWIAYEEPTLTIAAHVLDREEPVDLTQAFWNELADATAGWVVEMGDVHEHGSFEAFRAHLQAARLDTEWDAAGRVLSIRYASGGDTLEMGFRTSFARRHAWHEPYRVGDVFAHLRVNGGWPWLPRDVLMDSPLGVMGSAEQMEKGGARLTTAEGQVAFLKVEPVSGVYTAINPFLDPTPFRLETPEGIEVLSEGPLTLARVTVRPGENELRIDYHLPEAAHAAALRRVREEMVLTPNGEYITRPHLQAIGRLDAYLAAPRAPFFPAADIDPDDIAHVAARALLVRGFDAAPRVLLNGEWSPGPFAAHEINGAAYFRIPIVQP